MTDLAQLALDSATRMNKALTPRIDQLTLTDALTLALEFIEDQVDVVDGEHGPIPNKAMIVAGVIREALGR